MLTWMTILLWFICMVFIYNTIFWKQTQHFTYIVAGLSVLYLFPKYCIIDKNHTYKPQQYTHPSQHVNVNSLYIFTEHMYQWPLYQFLILLMMGACARNMQSDPAEIKPAQCCIKLLFLLTYTMMHGSTKLKFTISTSHYQLWRATPPSFCK